MKGGGLEFHIPILKNDFFENHRIIPWMWKRVLHLVWALFFIVVEGTLNIAK